MKKIISLALAIVFVALCLSGCQNAKYRKYDSTGERYDCYLPDYIDVPNYNNFEVPNLVFSASNEFIQKKLDHDRSLYSPDSYTPELGAEYCDTADIVTEAYVDGKIYDLYTFKLDNRNQGKSIVVGCNDLDVPEIDEAIYGMKEGETKTITFNLPDPFFRSLKMSGKEVTMKITLNSLYNVELVEETDDFFFEHFGYTINEYRAYYTKSYEDEYNGFIEDYKSDLVWEYIYNNSVVKKYPEELDEIYNGMLNSYRSTAKDSGTNLVDYVENTLKYKNIEDFYADLKESAKDTCKKEMINYYIARCENLKYTDEYYETELLEFAKNYEITDFNDAESFAHFMYGLDNFKERVQNNYVYDWLGSNAKLREDVTTYINDLNK